MGLTFFRERDHIEKNITINIKGKQCNLFTFRNRSSHSQKNVVTERSNSNEHKHALFGSRMKAYFGTEQLRTEKTRYYNVH
jgi:hypothetical protein